MIALSCAPNVHVEMCKSHFIIGRHIKSLCVCPSRDWSLTCHTVSSINVDAANHCAVCHRTVVMQRVLLALHRETKPVVTCGNGRAKKQTCKYRYCYNSRQSFLIHFSIISFLHPFFIFSIFNNINCYNNYFSYPNKHIKLSIFLLWIFDRGHYCRIYVITTCMKWEPRNQPFLPPY